MNTPLLAYEEVADFVASLAPEKVIAMKPSAKVQARLEELMSKKKESGISDEEQYELERYLALDHLIALAKVKARLGIAA